jgi:hypothetical protein
VTVLLWLIVPALFSVLASLVLYLRNRQPRSMEYGMEEFAKGLRAISPPDDGVMRRERR